MPVTNTDMTFYFPLGLAVNGMWVKFKFALLYSWRRTKWPGFVIILLISSSQEADAGGWQVQRLACSTEGVQDLFEKLIDYCLMLLTPTK